MIRIFVPVMVSKLSAKLIGFSALPSAAYRRWRALFGTRPKYLNEGQSV